MNFFNEISVHPSWLPLIKASLSHVDPLYLQQLQNDSEWLPGMQKVFNAFSEPLSSTRYILFGESPYPRPESANGYAFWDNAVTALWTDSGLAKPVNRATSLRNLIKMLLIAEEALSPADTSQPAIAKIDKRPYVQTISDLFQHLLAQGFLLLNATLVLSQAGVKKDAAAWQPFMAHLLELLSVQHPEVELVLFGQIARTIDSLPAALKFKHFYAEHPYNISFVYNTKVQDFFRPLHLLRKN